MFQEKRKGRKALDAVLEDYKSNLLWKNPQGNTIESAGPIVWGTRLQSSQNPGAWRAITYEKGSWILHMLRGRLGDENFLKMLGSLCQNYRFKAITTGQFQEEASRVLPPTSPARPPQPFSEQLLH